jgi:hypothetical protein
LEIKLSQTESKTFIIVAPRFTSKSAGVVTLYLLADFLGQLGHVVYVVRPGFSKSDKNTFRQISFFQYVIKWKKLRKGIAIYHESIPGEPLQTEHCVRYLLNTPGGVRSPRYSPLGSNIWSYSKEIARLSGAPLENILYLPVSDPSFFRPGVVDRNKQPLAYSGKHQIAPAELSKDFRVITRYGKLAPNRNELVDLLQSHEEIHVWENTAVALEATLCGCICVFHLNKDFQHPFALDELGTSGYAYSSDEDSVKLAKENVKEVRDAYLKLWGARANEVSLFVKKIDMAHRFSPKVTSLRPPLIVGLSGRLGGAFREGGLKKLTRHIYLALSSRYFRS